MANKRGLDISSYQAGLSLKAVKAAGYSFVIIRAGYTGIQSGTQKKVDSTFAGFYNQAKANGLGVGAYWYSCANSYAKGKAEAEFMIQHCLKGRKFEYPIFIDVEERRWQLVGRVAVGQAIKGFCETMEQHGYYAGFYTASSFLRSYIDAGLVAPYDLWIAQWSSARPSVGRGYGMWQYTANARVAGIQVDADIAYKDYPHIIKANGLNGFSKSKSTDKTKDDKTKSKAKKSVAQVAKEVIDGKWGNGDTRKTKLTKAGYDYNKVQAEVNKLVKK